MNIKDKRELINLVEKYGQLKFELGKDEFNSNLEKEKDNVLNEIINKIED